MISGAARVPIAPGETPVKAAVRETGEESGLTIDDPGPVRPWSLSPMPSEWGQLDADAAARASATMATFAWRTCSPVVHSPVKPRRTTARPAGLTAVVSKP